MNLKEDIIKVEELLSKILKSNDKLIPDEDLINKYVSLLTRITSNDPTKETANLGMKLMFMIYEAESQENSKRWIYDIAEKTYTYFRF